MPQAVTQAPACEEIVHFGIDGETFHLELPAEEAARLRELLHRYIAVARRVTAPQTRRVRMTAAQRAENQRIREWAAATPTVKPVHPLGRIPNTTRARYYAHRDRRQPGTTAARPRTARPLNLEPTFLATPDGGVSRTWPGAGGTRSEAAGPGR